MIISELIYYFIIKSNNFFLFSDKRIKKKDTNVIFILAYLASVISLFLLPISVRVAACEYPFYLHVYINTSVMSLNCQNILNFHIFNFSERFMTAFGISRCWAKHLAVDQILSCTFKRLPSLVPCWGRKSITRVRACTRAREGRGWERGGLDAEGVGWVLRNEAKPH